MVLSHAIAHRLVHVTPVSTNMSSSSFRASTSLSSLALLSTLLVSFILRLSWPGITKRYCSMSPFSSQPPSADSGQYYSCILSCAQSSLLSCDAKCSACRVLSSLTQQLRTPALSRTCDPSVQQLLLTPGQLSSLRLLLPSWPEVETYCTALSSDINSILYSL